MTDIDRFKNFNSNMATCSGDQVLRIVGKRPWRPARRASRPIAWGGAREFALLVPSRAPALTRQMAESLRRVIERMSILDRKSGRRIDHITASFGVGNTMARRRRMPLIERTDKLLYRRPRSWGATG